MLVQNHYGRFRIEGHRSQGPAVVDLGKGLFSVLRIFHDLKNSLVLYSPEATLVLKSVVSKLEKLQPL